MPEPDRAVLLALCEFGHYRWIQVAPDIAVMLTLHDLAEFIQLLCLSLFKEACCSLRCDALLKRVTVVP